LSNTKFIFIFIALCISSIAFAFDPLFAEESDADIPPCKNLNIDNPLTLTDSVTFALCKNPDAKIALANVAYQADLVGQARSSYLPSLNIDSSIGKTYYGSNSFHVSPLNRNLSLSANYLLYDFGAREAKNSYATAMFDAVSQTKDALLQTIFFNTVQAYYTLASANSALDASVEAENYALQSYMAAQKKYEVGAATPADKLQAQTSYSNAKLNTITAEGLVNNAKASLANAMGLSANEPIKLSTQNESVNIAGFNTDLNRLIDLAKQKRPELKNAEYSINAAQSNVQSAKSEFMPSISINGSRSYDSSSVFQQGRTDAGMITMSIPIFSGFSSLYALKAAKESLKSANASKEKEEKQITLEVYTAYQNILTQTQSLKAATDLLSSAEESYKMATGRYKAGKGNIIELLNAQSAFADAKKQKISAFYNWQIAKGALAKAIGVIDKNDIIKNEQEINIFKGNKNADK